MRKYFVSLWLILITSSWAYSGNFPKLGEGCTTARYIDRDCDGYGTGDAQNNGWLLGADADDTDPEVNTTASVIAKYGSVQTFITSPHGGHAGYTCDRYIVMQKGNTASTHSPQTTLAAAEATPYDDLNSYSGYTAGDCVVLRGGPTLASNLRYSGYTTLYWKFGTQAKPLIFMAYPGELVQLAFNGTTGQRNWVTFDGLVFDRTTLSSAITPDTDGGPPALALGFTVRNCQTYGDGGAGFIWQQQGLGHWLVEYNVFSGYNASIGSHFIYMGNRGYGSDINSATAIPSGDIIYRGNVFHSINDGIGAISYNGPVDASTYGTGITFEKNIFAENGAWWLNMIMGVSDLTVRNNVFLSHEVMRIGWYNECDPTSDPRCYGLPYNTYIKRFNMNNIDISNNTVLTTTRSLFPGSPSQGGLVMLYDDAMSQRTVKFTNFNIYNNIVEAYSSSVNNIIRMDDHTYGSMTDFIDCSANTLSIYNNLFYIPGGTNYLKLETSANNFTEYNMSGGGWVIGGNQKCPSLWHNNVVSDPLFISVSDSNYNNAPGQNVFTASNTPAKGMGASGGAATDIKANIRYGNDAGAYALTSGSLPPYTATHIRTNSGNTITLVFVGSGYAAGSDQTTFDNKVTLWHTNLFSPNWFANNTSKFNVWKINVESPTSGVPLTYAQAAGILAKCGISYHYAIFLHNEANGGYGFSQFGGMAPSNWEEFYTIDSDYQLPHELAHRFSEYVQTAAGVTIGDEYYNQGPCNDMSKVVFNSHDHPNNEKWSDLVATPPAQGSRYCATTLWRPWPSNQVCLMQDANSLHDFCPVDYKALDLSVGKILGTVESTPPSLTVTGVTRDGTYSRTVTVGATASDASGIERVEFYFGLYDGVHFTGQYRQNSVKIARTAPYAWDMDTTQYANGRYAVDVFVYDTNWNVTRYMVWFNINNSVVIVPPPPNLRTTN